VIEITRDERRDLLRDTCTNESFNNRHPTEDSTASKEKVLHFKPKRTQKAGERFPTGFLLKQFSTAAGSGTQSAPARTGR
jgi:hypothetical protein